MEEEEVYTRHEVIAAIKESISYSNRGKWEPGEAMNFLAGNITRLSPQNRQVFYGFFIENIEAGDPEYFDISLDCLLKLRVHELYPRLYACFSKLHYTTKNYKDRPREASKLMSLAYVLFKLKVPDTENIYKEFLMRCEKMSPKGIRLRSVYINYARIDKEWATARLARLYSVVYNENGEERKYLEADGELSGLFYLLVSADKEGPLLFFKSLRNENTEAFKWLQSLMLKYIDSGMAKRWLLNDEAIADMRSSLLL